MEIHFWHILGKENSVMALAALSDVWFLRPRGWEAICLQDGSHSQPRLRVLWVDWRCWSESWLPLELCEPALTVLETAALLGVIFFFIKNKNLMYILEDLLGLDSLLGGRNGVWRPSKEKVLEVAD